MFKAQVYNGSEKTGVKQHEILRGYLSGYSEFKICSVIFACRNKKPFQSKTEFAGACSYTVAIPKSKN